MDVNSIPVVFQKLSEFSGEDSRFIPVKIWLMHTGKNFNGSFFSKETVKEAMPSLANTPILGYVEENSDEEKDFSDHRSGLEKEEGKWKVKYQGRAYGMIPESCNPQFETKTGSDGVEREYLTCSGLIWTKFDDAVDIFARDIEKSESMEITDYAGYWDKKDGLYHFSSFRFNGACVLGKEVNPAMDGANIAVEFSKNTELLEQINEKLNEFQRILSSLESNTNNDKGGNNVDEKMELLTKFSLTREEVEAKGINFEEISLVDLETQLKSFSEEVPANNEVPADEVPVDAKEDAPADSFALSANQISQELRSNLSSQKKADKWGYEYQEFYMVDYIADQNLLIAYDSDDSFLVGMAYSVEGDKVTVDFNTVQRYKVEYVPMGVAQVEGEVTEPSTVMAVDLHKATLEHRENLLVEARGQFATVEAKVSEMQTELDKLKAENQALAEFKVSAEKATQEDAERQAQEAKDSLFESFSEKLTDEEMAPVREKSTEMALEEIEVQLFAMVGKKATKFSANKKQEKNTMKVPVDTSLESHVQFSKPWGHLVK